MKFTDPDPCSCPASLKVSACGGHPHNVRIYAGKLTAIAGSSTLAARVADGWHVQTDVLTSAGVIIGVALVSVTGWLVLDPIVAVLVGVNMRPPRARTFVRPSAS